MAQKITLLGDSIRLMGYGTMVPSLLGEDYTVWQPEDNCRFAQYTLRGLFDWAKDMEGSSVIHWNNGAWDITDLFLDGPFTPLHTYVDTMLRIADILKSRAPRVIFATTIPVRNDNPYNSNTVIAQYNRALVAKLRDMDVEINDLYTLVNADINRYIREDDKIHLTDDGIALCANAVASIIRNPKD